MKCPHGIYGDGWGCQICHPPGWGDSDQPAPVLPRSSSDPLNADRSEKRQTCANCGNVRTFFSDACRVCGTPFPTTDEQGRQQGTANVHQAGSCPDCGSTIHYETKSKREWECADCGKVFAAVRRKANE